jgi:hypothetical protein
MTMSKVGDLQKRVLKIGAKDKNTVINGSK